MQTDSVVYCLYRLLNLLASTDASENNRGPKEGAEEDRETVHLDM